MNKNIVDEKYGYLNTEKIIEITNKDIFDTISPLWKQLIANNQTNRNESSQINLALAACIIQQNNCIRELYSKLYLLKKDN